MSEKRNPTELNPVTGRDVAFQVVSGGQQFLGGFDITNLPIEDIFGPRALKRFRAAHPDKEMLRLDEVRALGIDPKEFRHDFRKELRSADLLTKRGTLASQALLEKFTADVGGADRVSAAQAQAGSILQSSVSLFETGLALAGGDLQNPIAQDVMRGYGEQFTRGLASRGFGNVGSGASAFAQTVGGLSALRQAGMEMMGGGLAGTQFAYMQDPFLNPSFALGRADLAYSQDLFDFLIRRESQGSHRAAQQIAEDTRQQNLVTGLAAGWSLFNQQRSGRQEDI